MVYKNKVLFLISKNSGLACLKSFVAYNKVQSQVFVMTFDDTVDERNCFEDIKYYCESENIDLKIVKNNREFLEIIFGYKFDAAFVCGWYWIIPNSVLLHLNDQVFGIHHSLLPKYRGFSPLVWSMINGDDIVGSSLFKISDGIDVGDVYYQWTVAGKGNKVKRVLAELESKIADNFGYVLKQILDGNNLGKEQDHSSASYCARRNIDSGLIDWSQPADRVLWFINAQTEPYPGAYFEIKGKRFIVESAELFTYPVYAKPGQVVMFLDSGIVIGCGDSRGIEVKEIRGNEELDKVLNSHDLVLGHSL
ncbi:methionyl-tRNA formyltransferase [Vibrio atypicus]|uniref:methionyl-tRNA formyltransferase n=1 Tax=Vibrio atypicus TaxID=558271 RepID=UPI00135C33DF|nr:formyltransferase family protein [Vibrio atypicus]